MASPPYSGGAMSPPNPSPLALPRQRPSLALPGGPKSRKPSLASNTPSAHPLRQTSFPPPDSLEAQHAAAEDAAFAYSPSAEGSLDDVSDTEIQSAISGPAGGGFGDRFEGGTKKRKRGEKRARGRPPKHAGFRSGTLAAGSIVNGDIGGPRRGAPSIVTGDGDVEAEDEEEEEEEAAGPGGGGRAPLYAGGELSTTEIEEQSKRQRLFYETVPSAHTERYDSYLRAKLKTADVRRLVNQTLSQSVPANVVLVVSAYTKMFAGMLIEGAREVQGEWEAVEERKADGTENPAFKKLKREAVRQSGHALCENENTSGKQLNPQGSMDHETDEVQVKAEPTTPSQAHDVLNGTTSSAEATRPNTADNTQTQDSTLSDASVRLGGAGGLSRSLAEPDRGPLLPDHFREALRRYKKGRAGGTVGFTGLSLEGREVAASRMGGRSLFR